MEKIYQIHQIYDSIFKRIFSLSSLAIVNLINGLFGTNHPPDSEVQYCNREFHNRKLKKKFADVFASINGTTYHLEAQMTKDDFIVVRVFEYGFYQAMSVRGDEGDILRFPEPIVIYLDSGMSGIPKESTLLLDFGEQGTFEYKVTNFMYQEHDVVELNQKKMVVLIPFQLLKLRKLIAEKPSKENFERLRTLIEDDILVSIEANLRVGNITEDDASQLRELTKQLYGHIYAHYEELGGYGAMKPLLDGAMELPLDKYRIRIDELEEEVAKAKAEKAEALEAEKAKAAAEKAEAEAEKAKAEAEKAKAEAEIQKLRDRIKELEQGK